MLGRRRSRLVALATVLVAVLAAPPSGDAHFSVAPKLEVGPDDLDRPEAPFLTLGDVTATRGDFHAHLQRITAFDTKYDRMQPNFWLHLELVRSIALLHPENVHSVVDELRASDSLPDRQRALLNEWVIRQAEVYIGLQLALAEASADKPLAPVVLDLYAAGVKTEFLEELVVLGTMEASLAGLEAFLAQIPADQRRSIETGTEQDTELTPEDEQARLRARWAAFRNDVVAAAGVEHRCGSIDSLEAPAGTVVIDGFGHQVTFGDVLTVFGRPLHDRQWIAIRQGHCARIVSLLATGAVVDRLDLSNDRIETKIATSRRLYLAAEAVVQRLAPEAAGDGAQDMLTALRALTQLDRVTDLRDALIVDAQAGFAASGGSIDIDFLRQTPWTLDRVMAPQHSIHF